MKLVSITPENIYVTVNSIQYAIGEHPDLNLEIFSLPSSGNTENILDFKLTNRGSGPLKIDSIELQFDSDSFDKNIIDSCRFYKEGLTVVGVAGARSKSDYDFELDPEFLRFTVSDADTYSWNKKNIFYGEQVGIVNNSQTGENTLFGFVTAKKYLCRIILDISRDILLTAIIDTDGIMINPGNTISLEKLIISTNHDAEELLKTYATETARQMNAIHTQKIPSGWCSYYFYYGQETEDDIIENAEFLTKHKETIPVEYIQIDDGWQKARGDWLESNQKKFPHGMKWLAEKIKDIGFKPGIWVAPFLVAKDTPVYCEHNDWLLHDKNGILLDMGGNYFLDTSHPDALNWLSEVFKTIHSWGYSYFKLDFMMVETCYGAQYYDKTISRLQAYRKGLQTIRNAVGPDSFLLGGTSLLTPNVGLVNGCRISTDVTPFWCKEEHTPESPTIFNVCRNIINRGYMHKRLWINDPDCLIVREYHNREKYKDMPSLTIKETHMLASAMIMSGGAIFLGDRLATLSQSRLDIIRTVFKLITETPAIPLDRMEREIPRIWFRKSSGTNDNPHLLALFNWDTDPGNIHIQTKDLGLNKDNEYIYTDIWNKNMTIDLSASGDFNLPPHTCRLIGITGLPVGNH